VPFHIRAPLPDLSALIEQLQQAGSGEEAGLTVKDLADCFRRILDSCPVDAALNLKKPRHREPDVATTERNEMIALDMGLEIQNGASYTDASTIVAENWKKHSSFKNIPVLRVRETVKNDPHCHLKVMTIRRFKYPSRK
jgi:hypothetical protein